MCFQLVLDQGIRVASRLRVGQLILHQGSGLVLLLWGGQRILGRLGIRLVSRERVRKTMGLKIGLASSGGGRVILGLDASSAGQPNQVSPSRALREEEPVQAQRVESRLVHGRCGTLRDLL